MEGEKKLCHLRIGGDLKKEMKQEYYVIYMTKSRGPRTEPWGDTTEASMWRGEIIIAFDTNTE